MLKKIAIVILSLLFCFPIYLKSEAFTDNFFFNKYFHIVFTSLVFIGITSLYSIQKKLYHIRIAKTDIALAAFYLYTVICIAITDNELFYNTNFLLLSVLVGLYLGIRIIFSDSQDKDYTLFLVFLIGSGILELLWGWLQYFEIIKRTSVFLTLGSFSNPGPYSNYLVAIFPVALGIIVFQHKNKKLLTLALTYVIGTIAILPLTNARTSWLAMLGSVAILVASRWNIWGRIVELRIIYKIMLSTAISTIVIAAGLYMFSYKVDSSKGRVFIWKQSMHMITEKPFAGHGFESFDKSYNDFQVDYFEQHPTNSEEAMLADNKGYAYNEFIHITVEQGIVGLLLFLSILFFVFTNYKGSKKQYSDTDFPYKFIWITGLIAILTTSLFSYPFRVVPTFTLFFVFIALSVRNEENPFFSFTIPQKTGKILAVAMTIFVCGVILQQQHKMAAYKKWKKARELSLRNNNRGLAMYAEIHKTLQHYPLFLYNYGAELSIKKEFTKSIEVLEKAKPYMNDYNLYSYLGNSYEGIKDYYNAEKNFYRATKLIPHKLYAKYRLVYVYINQNKNQEAYNLAKNIIATPEKIKNKKSEAIKSELQNVIVYLEEKYGY